MGLFNFGSTVVMIAEVRNDAKVLVENGDKVRYG
jgi:hypothetical protein